MYVFDHHHIEFEDYLILRYQPCIHCSFTSEFNREFPDYFEKVKNIWYKIARKGKIKLRLIRTDKNCDKKQIVDLMEDLTRIYKNRSQTEKINRETRSISYLRQILFNFELGNSGFLIDIPYGVLVFTKANEDVDFPYEIPEWAKDSRYNVNLPLCKVHHYIEDGDELISSLKSLYDKVISNIKDSISILDDEVSTEFKHIFTSESYDMEDLLDYIDYRMNDSNMLVPIIKVINLYLLNKDMNSAYRVCKHLFNRKRVIKADEYKLTLISMCTNLSLLFDDDIDNILRYSRSLIKKSAKFGEYTHALYMLVDFFINMKFNDDPLIYSESLLDSCKNYSLISPFLYEQRAYCSSEYIRPYFLYKASKLFFENGFHRHYLRSITNLFMCMEGKNLLIGQMYIFTESLKNFIQLVDSDVNYVEKFSKLAYRIVSKNSIPSVVQFVSLLPFISVGSFNECGFIEYRLISVRNKEILNLDSKLNCYYYNKIFGFLGYTQNYHEEEITLGDSIIIHLSIHNKETIGNIDSLNIEFEGNGESKHIASDNYSSYSFEVVPTSLGEINIRGMKVEWFDRNIEFHIKFRENLTYTVPKDSPLVCFSIEKNLYETFIGDADYVQLKLSTKLNSLRKVGFFAINVLSAYILYKNRILCISEHSQVLEDLAINTEQNYKIFVADTKPGIYNPVIIASYRFGNDKRSLRRLDFSVNNISISLDFIPYFPHICKYDQTKEYITKEIPIYFEFSVSNKNYVTQTFYFKNNIADLTIRISELVSGKTCYRLDKASGGSSLKIEYYFFGYALLYLSFGDVTYASDMTQILYMLLNDI